MSEPAQRCSAAICGLADRPHVHCECGLPMLPNSGACLVCATEDAAVVAPTGGRLDSIAWDGMSYRSRRRVRFGQPTREAYERLVAVVLQPAEPCDLRLGGASAGRRRSVTERRDQSASPAAIALARQLAGSAGVLTMRRGGCHG